MATAVDSAVPIECFKVDLDLSEEFLKTADTGPKETPENRAEKIQEMLKLINDEPDLITRTDDQHLLRFLRAKYFNTKYAFQLVKVIAILQVWFDWEYFPHLITYLQGERELVMNPVISYALVQQLSPELKNYEEFKLKHHDTWLNVSNPILKNLTCNGVIQVLPVRDQLGRRILYLKGGLWKPSDCSSDYVLQAGGLCGDATIVEPMTQVAGVIMIFDLKDVGMSQFKGLGASFAKKMVYFLAHCLPLRINAIHVINEPSIFSMIFPIFKTFLTDRMKKRLYFHGSNFSSLHEHVTLKCLPAELGGSIGEVDPNEWYKVLTSDLVMKELLSFGYKFHDDLKVKK